MSKTSVPSLHIASKHCFTNLSYTRPCGQGHGAQCGFFFFLIMDFGTSHCSRVFTRVGSFLCSCKVFFIYSPGCFFSPQPFLSQSKYLLLALLVGEPGLRVPSKVIVSPLQNPGGDGEPAGDQFPSFLVFMIQLLTYFKSFINILVKYFKLCCLPLVFLKSKKTVAWN